MKKTICISLMFLIAFMSFAGVCYADNFVSECELLETSQNSETGNQVKNILGDITEDDWVIGPDDAILTLLEYSDFQCPYCPSASISLLDFQREHPDEVRVVYRHFPLSFHPLAVVATAAADAAGNQGKFFEAEEFIFNTQKEWTSLDSEDAFADWFYTQLEENDELSDFDAEQWEKDFSDEKLQKRARSYFNEVLNTGIVNGTPTIYANFIPLDTDLDTVLEMVRMEQTYINSCPDVVIDPNKNYEATIDTNIGEIHVRLFADTAPLTVNNFKFLADQGWYDDIEIFREQENFLVQTGDPTNTGYGQPGYYIATEYDEAHQYGEKGMLGMANSGRNKNGSQFFITYDLYDYYLGAVKQEHEDDGEALALDYEEQLRGEIHDRLNKLSQAYTIFGQVKEEDLGLLDKLEIGTVIKSISVSEITPED